MVKMVSKIVQKLKRAKTKVSHREIFEEESVGVEIADVWAGYINSRLNDDDFK